MKDRTRLLIVDEQVWIPYTYAEEAMIVDIMEKLPEEQVAEPVTFAGESNGKRTTEKQASVYDAMMAEIYAERNKAKARRVRKPDSRTKAERILDWESGRIDRWERRLRSRWNHLDKKYGYLGKKQLKDAYAEIDAWADWKLESAEIEMDAEFNFWTQKIENERLASLNEWLQYA